MPWVASPNPMSRCYQIRDVDLPPYQSKAASVNGPCGPSDVSDAYAQAPQALHTQENLENMSTAPLLIVRCKSHITCGWYEKYGCTTSPAFLPISQAAGILFLASEAASFVTGTELLIDGGGHLMRETVPDLTS